MSEVKFCDVHDGDEFRCKIQGVEARGKITIEDDGDVYLCQNVHVGHVCKDMKGFDNSWWVGDVGRDVSSDSCINGHQMVTDFELILDPADIRCWKTGDIITNGEYFRRILFINQWVIACANGNRKLEKIDTEPAQAVRSYAEFLGRCPGYYLYHKPAEPTEEEKAIALLEKAGRIKDGKILDAS